jgi:hypothetical protein
VGGGGHALSHRPGLFTRQRFFAHQPSPCAPSLVHHPTHTYNWQSKWKSSCQLGCSVVAIGFLVAVTPPALLLHLRRHESCTRLFAIAGSWTSKHLLPPHPTPATPTVPVAVSFGTQVQLVGRVQSVSVAERLKHFKDIFHNKRWEWASCRWSNGLQPVHGLLQRTSGTWCAGFSSLVRA